jgi:hypothetical protein
MKILLSLIFMLIPVFAGAHMEVDYGYHHMMDFTGAGWLVMLSWIVWLGVGILAFIWLLRKLVK